MANSTKNTIAETIRIVISAINTFADAFTVLWNYVMSWFNGYKIAAGVMAVLWAGTRADSNSPIFAAIQRQVPMMSPVLWEAIFMFGFVRMATLKEGSRFEAIFVGACFISPVSFLLLELLDLTLHSATGRMSYFTISILVSCLIILLYFVAHTTTFNYYKIRAAQVEVINDQMRKQIIKLQEQLDKVQNQTTKVKPDTPGETADAV